MQRIGFIGLGNMGAAMARNVLKAGFELAVYNRDPAKAASFEREGVVRFDSPRALAEAVDAVVVMVTGPEALRAVLDGEQGAAAGLAAGAPLVNMSTVSPEATQAAAELVSRRGGRFVDAPVSGTVKPAEEGKLVVLAGAAQADLEAVRPVLQAMGRSIIHCGGIGQGTRMKLVLNHMLGGMMQVLSEGLALAEGLELTIPQVLDALQDGPMNAPMFQLKGEAIAAGRYAKQFPVELLFKDCNLLLDAAGKAGVPVPLAATVREQVSMARSMGFADQDMAALYRVMRQLSGA